MNIGFFHVDTNTVTSEQGYACARALLKSARKQMPDVPVIHFTDEASPGVRGVDAVRRKPSEPMALLRMRHHAGVEGDWLFVDTDVIFQRSVEKVFEREFEIAITDRTWPHLRPAVGFTERMPFNTGVVFSRCPRFWRDVYTRLRVLDAAAQQWMGDQAVICELVTDEAPQYVVDILAGYRYNFPPKVDTEVDRSEELERDAWILHYKGPSRKPMLLRRIQRKREGRCA